MSDDPSAAEARHQPQQARSQETFAALLDAAAALYAAQGYEQTTTHQIAKRADVSVGALYRYFDGKEALLKELYNREIAALRRRVLQAFTVVDLVGQDPRQLVRKVLALAFEVYGERPDLRRVLWTQARKIPALAAQRRAQEAEVHAAVAQILSTVSGVRLPDIEAGAYLITLFIESLKEDQLLHRHEGSLADERLIDAASDFLLRYVMGQVPPTPA
jgi:AcrR family transcriptional regulator